MAALKDAHIQHLIRLAQDPMLTDLMGWDTCFAEHETAAFIEAISLFAFPYSRTSEPVVFGIYVKSQTCPIGYVVLKGLNTDLCTAEVGIAILDRQYWHQGIGREALRLIMDYGVNKLQLHTLAAAALATNKRSIQLFQKLGFKVRETWYRSWPMPNGDLADMLWLEWIA
ncbi:GNAT family N-acetyltransferase [Leptolyngbya cf. ectocarpi LEGE 11479]|uniref:GNAT family N-acetyltransferase n=1 Tax=Leptolyngbya cf. ectocarpi LEGE 11479 TaxID=1828722 RepID=A0A929F629_LEPEC|nr:GNAT family N-acetyltransferase [Leptolyngbya cf. ectocarpi LEGE 11479]